MLLILIAIIVAAVVGIALLRYGFDGRYGGMEFAAALAGFLLCVATGFSAVTYAFAGWSWIASESKAEIINREYGTTYTREEIFFAADVIDTIREIDRKRVEVNGDLLREEADE